MGVDVEARPAHEADQRLAEPLRGIDREVRRRRDRGEDRNAGDGGLLHDLEAHPAADEEDSIAQREHAGQELRADELVQGVVPADVLAQGDEVTIEVEQAGGVEAARRLEDRLRIPERARQAEDGFRVHDPRANRDRVAADGDLVE